MGSEYSSARSKRYSAVKTRIFVADTAVTVISLAVFQLFLSRPVSRMAAGTSANFYVSCLIFSGIFLLFLYAVSFPLHLTGSFIVERRFGLSRQSLAGWLADEAKATVLSFGLSVACIEVFYLVLRNFPSSWWLISAAGWIFFSVLLTRFLPVLLIPIFFRYLPIEDVLLREKIMALADKAGVRLMDVCKIDFSRKTAKANAAVVGLGTTRKVILADTLTDRFAPEEVETVVAHEFAHCVYRHIWKLLAVSGMLTVAGLYVFFLIADRIVLLAGAAGLSDLYLLPVLVLMMVAAGIVLMPAQNFFSRVLERQADRFALELTGRPDEFISVMKKLAETNLADTEPSLLKKIFLYNHPPISERIRMAEEFRRKAEGS